MFSGYSRGNAGPSAARGERSRDGQHDVAQRFRVEPAAIHPPQQAIVGIDRVRPAVVRTAHGVGTAQHQAADQALLGPAVRDEPQREGVEQLRVGGRLAATSEVIDRADDPLAEQPLPDAIHGDPRGQRIVAARDPVGQLAAAALTGRDQCWPVLRDDPHEPSGDLVAQRVGVAPDRDPHAARPGGIVHGEGDRHGRGEELGMLDVRGELADAGLQLPPLLLECLPRRRVDPVAPPALPLTLEYRADLPDAMPCPLTFGRERPDGFPMLLEPGFPLGLFRRGFRQLGDRRPAPYAPLGPADRLRAGEDPRQCVVVAERDGIELVVVAPRTAEGHAQERLAHLVDLLIDHVDAQLGLVRLDDRQVAQDEEAGGDQIPGSLLGGTVGEQVAGELLVDETVERPVGVERRDDVIAIPPGVLGEDVVGRADLVGIARQVQPVPCPALAERR